MTNSAHKRGSAVRFYRLIFIFILFFMLGLFAPQLLGYDANELADSYIERHFRDHLEGCENAREAFVRVLGLSGHDTRQLLTVFVAGFTMFCAAAAFAINAYRAFSLGFSLAYLSSAARSGIPFVAHIGAAFAVYLVCGIIISAAMLWVCAKTIGFAREFRSAGGPRTRIVTTAAFRSYAVSALSMLGTIIIVNFTRCFLFSLLF